MVPYIILVLAAGGMLYAIVRAAEVFIESGMHIREVKEDEPKS